VIELMRSLELPGASGEYNRNGSALRTDWLNWEEEIRLRQK
jgi:hypothetical protein